MQSAARTSNDLASSVIGYDAQFKDRLSTAIEIIGSVKAASAIAGVTDEQLAKWRDGKSRAPFFALAALCLAAGKSLDWLAGVEPADRDAVQARHSQAPIDLSGFTMIPRLDIEAAAGHGSMSITEEAQSLLAFDSAWLRRRGINPSSAHVLTARGDSMEPTIRSGDILLVDTSIDRIDDNGIYIVRVSGMLLVKRIHVMMHRALLLISDNKELYPPEEINAADATDLHVAGRVMWFGRSI